MDNNIKNILDKINNHGLNLERAEKLIECYLDYDVSKFNSVCNVDKNAIPFLSRQLLKEFNRSVGKITLNEKKPFYIYNMDVKCFSSILLNNSLLIGMARANSDSYEEPFNFSVAKFFNKLDTFKDILILHTKEHEYFLGNNGLFSYNSYDDSVYTYYKFNSDGEVISSTHVDKGRGIFNVDGNIYRINKPDIVERKSKNIGVKYERDKLINIVYQPILMHRNIDIRPKALETYLYTLSGKGSKTHVNDDSVVAISHPKDNSIKLLAVADGMNDNEVGDMLSSTVIQNLKNWFCNLNLTNFDDLFSLKIDLIKTIQDIDLILKEKNNEDDKSIGTTLTCAIVTHTNTLIGNVGSSKCYALKDTDMEQLDDDRYEDYQIYNDGKITKSKLSYFNAQDNVLGNDIVNLGISVIDNNLYDKLLLVTNGVTNCLTDERIKFIADTSEKDKILYNIIDEAISGSNTKQVINIPYFMRRKKSLPNNVTGAMLIKK